jgi:hypothetical protein
MSAVNTYATRFKINEREFFGWKAIVDLAAVVLCRGQREELIPISLLDSDLIRTILLHAFPKPMIKEIVIPLAAWVGRMESFPMTIYALPQ